MTLRSEPFSPYPAPGEVIDAKYRCERLIGVGGMGAVLHATHLLRKAPVALKFMNPDIVGQASHVERFINEAVAASRIDSEHVVKIFDVGQLPDGTPFLVMEYLEGSDLSEVLARDGEPGLSSIPRCLHFAVQALRGLQLAHDSGIIHRDMKPSNCFVIEKEGDPDFVKLLDFGISKLQQPDDIKLTQTNSMLGTPLYMPPEQARSAKLVDHRSDLYAVGVILYELLSGQPPFNSDSTFADLLLKIAMGEPEPLTDLRPDVPPELAAIVRRAFARDPNDRYTSAFELSEALAPWCDDRSYAVLDAARRRAGRATGLPVALSSEARGAVQVTSPAASAIQSEVSSTLVLRSSHAGVATTAPGADSSSKGKVMIGAVVAVVVAAVAAVAGFLSSREPGDVPSVSVAVSATDHVVASAAGEVKEAPLVVVEQEGPEPPPAQSVAASASVPATSTGIPKPRVSPGMVSGSPREVPTEKGPPKLKEITIQQ
jgi:serine/threonine-protein kinase